MQYLNFRYFLLFSVFRYFLLDALGHECYHFRNFRLALKPVRG